MALMIYILRTKNTEPSYLKVGYTKREINKRIKAIQTGCPFELELVDIRQGSQEKEQALHVELSKHRTKLKGEWYADSVEVRGLLGIHAAIRKERKVMGDREIEIRKILFSCRGSTRLLDDFCTEFNVTEDELEELAKNSDTWCFDLVVTSMDYEMSSAPFIGPKFSGKRACIWIFRNQPVLAVS